MTINPAYPGAQLLHEVFSEEQCHGYPALSAYLEQGGSIFPLVEKGVAGLVDKYGLSLSDAQTLLWRANAVALYVRRQFIEQALVGDKREFSRPMSGLLSMVDGPSFERLFGGAFNSLCPPDALESETSPVAYMVYLFKLIRDGIEPWGDTLEKMPLFENRRVDLNELIIDFNAVHHAVSSVSIITPVLEKFINANRGNSADIDAAMSLVRYPNGLPYHRDWATIDFVARQHDLSIGSMARSVDEFFPYFLQSGLPSFGMSLALLHASRLGPYQQMLLSESPAFKDLNGPPEESVISGVFDEDKEAFYKLNFGVDGLESQNLNQVPFFCERTKSDAFGLEASLSIRSFAPDRSPNAPLSGTEPPTGELSGSVYVNAGRAPAMSINYGVEPAFMHRINNVSDARFDRLNRKIRLDQWLGLPSEQVDALIMAAINAEGRYRTPEHNCWMSLDTLRAIGLFQELRERYGCTAEDFAVFIDELSVYGRGEQPSQFDRIFNTQTFFAEPLQIDGGKFPVFPVSGAEALRVNQLCSGLGINLHIYRHLAQAVAQAYDSGVTLHGNVSVFSSLYRMVKLPRLLGITPVEAIVLLMTLGGTPWLEALAGVPQFNPARPGSKPDVLNVIHAMDACIQWCHASDLPLEWVLQQVSPIMTPATSLNEDVLLEQVRNLLVSALFSNTTLLMAGVPPLAGGAGWLDLLSTLVDSQGLVIAQVEPIELNYQDFARDELDKAVRAGIGEGDETSRAGVVDKMLGVLLQARAGQVSVVKECLAAYTGLRSELIVPVLTWANGTVYQVLKHSFEHPGPGDEAALEHRQQEDIDDQFLTLLADIGRRSAVVMKLDLSLEVLEEYLAYGYRAWFGRGDKHELSLNTLYYLALLTRAFAMSEQPATKLLDYLRQVNALPETLLGDSLLLAQESAAIRLAVFFTWSVQEVTECARRSNPQKVLIKSLVHLDLLMRVRALAERTGMDAEAVFLIGTLPASVDNPAYEEAARHALVSLSASPVTLAHHDDEALENMVVTTCTVTPTVLVANKPEEQAIFTVTVTNLAGKALKGIKVNWQTELGSFSDSSTDTDGRVDAVFTPGSVMGTASPRYWLDLLEKQQAPSVVIGVDIASLSFPAGLMSQVPEGDVPLGQEVELFAVMTDDFDNLAMGMPVQWSCGPMGERVAQIQAIIRPSEALTNQEGLTRVFVSSRVAGTFEFGVTSADHYKISYFEPITFVDNTSAL